MNKAVQDWINSDPDPASQEELERLTETELAERFSSPLTFGTAGLRGPVRAGTHGMNLAVVIRTTAGLGSWLSAHGHGGSRVVVGRDARHGSEAFATAAAEVLAAAGFEVILLPRPLPTPVVAFAVRRLAASAGIQITASHNPATDNGYKVYLDGGSQLVSPADREIESAITRVGGASDVPRTAVKSADNTLVEQYVSRVAALPHGSARNIRIALTPLHGVGGETALSALQAAGFTDIHVVAEQFDPDPNFPTVTFPNPEEPGVADAVLALAEKVNADLAIALDPDADRCAVGIRDSEGWRMLRGDETGVLLADHVVSIAPPNSLVATTIVSSTLLSKLAPARGARFACTLTGFKWLTRAGDGLVYAYEEAIGHCVDPDVVRDKDGISAAVLVSDLVATLAETNRTLLDVLGDYALEFGYHHGDQVSRRVADISARMRRLRANPPVELAGEKVVVEDLFLPESPLHTDAMVFTGATTRVVVRPSGTEPKLKFYLEVVIPVNNRSELAEAQAAAKARAEKLRAFAMNL
ncbi:phospho-sugar mutase [Rhodococcus sp. IEGM 1379]|uniref:phospho-sugar mutase n=1 Tax=Rhodococcus sp. IEGM 1379 TaxID=3047086 RepID=UPI0024B8738E|nr:phospho-sugar mutase [Rhodococcus sp. IEGM 1379]MDI9914765.1 phospho-sugar mutase [Rhodococcus sp. IEGM 1379]